VTGKFSIHWLADNHLNTVENLLLKGVAVFFVFTKWSELTAVVWRDVDMFTNIHDPPIEGNFRDEHGNAIKPAIVADYNRHMGYVDKADRMASSYMASRRTWKWTKKLFLHLLDMTILNSYILLSACGGKKISHRDFRFTLVREMLAWAGHEP